MLLPIGHYAKIITLTENSMPTRGDVDATYPALLEQENKIRLLQPFIGAKQHHEMQCIICSHIWVATPVSKRQTFKKYGVGGCPSCNTASRQENFRLHRTLVLARLAESGVVILDATYDGRLRLNPTGKLKDEKILVQNINCGHQFFVTPLNLIQSDITCTVCGIQRRITNATNWSKANAAQWKDSASEWQVYKSTVVSATEQTYRQYKHEINPNGYIRGIAGQLYSYHLDHIVPKKWCFEHDVPPVLCAHKDNLQMLYWADNLSASGNLKDGPILPIFESYV